MMYKGALNIIQALQDGGYIAYLAGGCVRDMLLRVNPKDYDIATNATPGQVQSIFPRAHEIGAHFGVMLVREEGYDFEIATFRTDGDYGDGRRPDDVAFSTPQEDAFRRDFTINGIFHDPISENIYDYSEGQQDIQSRIIRAIGNPEERFMEDALRLMRAVRFSVVLDFIIEEKTWEAICRNSHLLRNVSMERISQELNKILLHPRRAQGLDLLVDSGLMKYIIPEVLDLKGCQQPPQFHPEGDVYVHTYMMLGFLKEDPSLELCLATLLHDIGKPATYSYDYDIGRIRFSGHDRVGADMSRTILNRLKYPKDTIKKVVSMVDHHMRFISVSRMKKSTIRRMLARETISDDLELHRVDCLGSNGNLGNYNFVLDKQKEFINEPVIPEWFITGKDLIDMGMQPGPEFKKILTRMQERQLEGELTSRKEAFVFLDSQDL